jgi:hypothetical protein
VTTIQAWLNRWGQPSDDDAGHGYGHEHHGSEISGPFAEIAVLGDMWSTDWDGAVPADLSGGPDTGATQGWYLDSSAGAIQIMNVYAEGGQLESLLITGNITLSTGGLIRTAVSGQRLEISEAAKDRINLFAGTGEAGEAPGFIYSADDGGTPPAPQVKLRSPADTALPSVAEIILEPKASGAVVGEIKLSGTLIVTHAGTFEGNVTLTAAKVLSVDNIASTTTDGDISLNPNGTGDVSLTGASLKLDVTEKVLVGGNAINQGCVVYRSAAYTTVASGTAISFDAADADANNWWAVSPNPTRITPSGIESGSMLMLVGSIGISGGTDWTFVRATLLKNGAVIRFGPKVGKISGEGIQQAQVMAVVDYASNDYFELRLDHDETTTDPDVRTGWNSERRSTTTVSRNWPLPPWVP